MRHFGDSAQPNNNGSASEQLAAVSKSESGANLARFIHDQFSPANRYDMPSSPQSLAATLPTLSFRPESNRESGLEPEGRSTQNFSTILEQRQEQRAVQIPAQWSSAESHKSIEIKNLGNLFSPAPEKTNNAASGVEDFRSPFKSMGQLSLASDKTKVATVADLDAPFEAANCYQTIQINPQEGSTKTITTLSDLSSSRIHIKSADSSSITYTDRLGRPISESRFDASGKLISETTAQFDNTSNAAIPTRKIVRTASETTEISLDSKGMILTKTTLPTTDVSGQSNFSKAASPSYSHLSNA